MTSPMKSSGVRTSTFMTGSSSTGVASRAAAWAPIEPAIWKAISRRVDLVEAAAREPDLDVDHGVAGHDAARQRLAHAALDRRDELARDAAADGVVLEDDAAALGRLDVEHDVAVLAAAARLADELALGVGAAADRLAVRDLRAGPRWPRP